MPPHDGPTRPVATGFRLGSLTIDLDQGVVLSEGGGASGLTPRAEDLLLLLARRANMRVSREDILETVWAGRVVEDAAITHCVWQIRRALGDEGKDILQTRPKRGYVLVVPDEAWIRPLTAASAVEQTGDAPIEAVAPPQRAGRRRGWWALALIAVVACAGLVAWRTSSSGEGIALDPHIEMSASVLAPPSLSWLRDTLLRDAIEQAHLRDVEVVVFQRAQSHNPFRGPHLQVRIVRADPRALEAELSLAQGDADVRERYRGPAEGLPAALRALLARHLPVPTRAPGAATDAYVAGRLAEARFDRATALLEFRRALALDAGMADAHIALAGLLFEQGRADEAREAVRGLAGVGDADPVRRCRIERLLARVEPDRLGPKPCARAAMVARVERLQLRDALREIERLDATTAGAGEWLEQEDAFILALLRLQELDRAKYEIERARAVAERAGWRHAALRLETNLGPLHMHRGERRAAAQAQARVADGFAALGDGGSAVESRIWVQRAEPIVPGASLAARREQLRGIVAQARASGRLRAEIEALLLLARMDRDRPEAWRAHLGRARARIREARLDGGNSLHPYFVVGEVVGARRYGEALAEIDALARVPQPHPRAPAWALYLQVESHFWRDEMADAVAGIDAMERAGLDITASPNPCFHAWVLTEAGRRDRASAYLERCNDGARSHEQTDFGLVAAARQRMLDGEPRAAWGLLRPRLQALLAVPEPTRQEGEALALVARHAALLPGADPTPLAQAAQVVDRVAAQDGAGPGLRLGARLLRDALCLRSGDCRPGPLPDWAAEDRFAARLTTSVRTAGAQATR
jgi:DNA-binding winged helix-turn-helix (wHTH) protein/tetratricopeptide (TPR) repeat protein